MKNKLYLVGNAHLDPVWQWRWQEGSAEAKATIRSALDRMKEFPEFRFVCSSASVYQWVEAFARQSLYAQRYFKETFGMTARVGYNVDSFGHNEMLPQILKKAAWTVIFSCVPAFTRRKWTATSLNGYPPTVLLSLHTKFWTLIASILKP